MENGYIGLLIIVAIGILLTLCRLIIRGKTPEVEEMQVAGVGLVRIFRNDISTSEEYHAELKWKKASEKHMILIQQHVEEFEKINKRRNKTIA